LPEWLSKDSTAKTIALQALEESEFIAYTNGMDGSFYKFSLDRITFYFIIKKKPGGFK